jgi:hypothetical protein
MPPSFHTSVKSRRSNQLLEATVMNDALEPWSQPWHALQRTLATAFGADAAAYLPPGGRPTDAGKRAADAASWLVRARSGAASAALFSAPR